MSSGCCWVSSGVAGCRWLGTVRGTRSPSWFGRHVPAVSPGGVGPLQVLLSVAQCRAVSPGVARCRRVRLAALLLAAGGGVSRAGSALALGERVGVVLSPRPSVIGGASRVDTRGHWRRTPADTARWPPSMSRDRRDARLNSDHPQKPGEYQELTPMFGSHATRTVCIAIIDDFSYRV